MLSIVLCLVFTAIATVTDLARHTIYNGNTYTGVLTALAVRAWQGQPEFVDGLEGFLTCGGIMLLCFVLFDVGGGDVKLLSMVGAFLGLEMGIIVMLWTFVLGSVAAVAVIVWQAGAWKLATGVWSHLKLTWKSRGAVPLTPQERERLSRPLYLAPAALVALGIVSGEQLWNWLSYTE